MVNPTPTPPSGISLEVIIWAFGLFIGIILSLITVIYNIMMGKIKSIEHNQSEFANGIWTEVNDIKKESKQVETNFLNKVIEINKNIDEGNARIIEKLNDFMIQVSSGKFPQKSD